MPVQPIKNNDSESVEIIFPQQNEPTKLIKPQLFSKVDKEKDTNPTCFFPMQSFDQNQKLTQI